MTQPITISLDAMSGDHGPEVVVPAALDMLAAHPGLRLVLVGDTAVLEPMLARARAGVRERLSLQHASQVVTMDELPSQALRGKKDSSMRVAINLVKEGRADACVSAGNTGALMATARFVLKTLPGIDRPAIISAIPTHHGHTHMLDLGANASAEPEHLYQFGVMGAVVATAVYDSERPTVGLLNIGEEEIKGNETVKQAHQLLGSSKLNYIGFVEGNDIFTGKVDVVVTDGFTGNVALKSMEGLARTIGQFIREEYTRHWYARLIALISLPVINSLKKRLDPRRYNGASLVGLRGIVIKSHGSADAVAFENAIRIAMLEVKNQVPNRISRLLGAELANGDRQKAVN